MNLVIPWIATFAFGAAVFGVGKYLQGIEKKKRLEKKAAKLREELMRQANTPPVGSGSALGLQSGALNLGQPPSSRWN